MREQHREDDNTYGACVALQGYTNYALDPKKKTYAQVPSQAPPFMGVNPAGNPMPQYMSYAAQAPASYGAADSAASQTPVWQQVAAVNTVTRSQNARHFAKMLHGHVQGAAVMDAEPKHSAFVGSWHTLLNADQVALMHSKFFSYTRHSWGPAPR